MHWRGRLTLASTLRVRRPWLLPQRNLPSKPRFKKSSSSSKWQKQFEILRISPEESRESEGFLNLGLDLDTRRERGTAADRLLFGGKCEERGGGILLAALAVRDVQGVGGQVPGAEEGE